MMVTWEGQAWRKKNVRGLCFYIYHCTRQAELEEGYLRQRHLRNKLGSPSSCMGLLKTWLWQPGSCKLDTEQQPLLSGPGRGSSLLPLSVNSFSCAAGLEPAEDLGTFCCPTVFETSGDGLCEKSETRSTRVVGVFVCGRRVAHTALHKDCQGSATQWGSRRPATKNESRNAARGLA